MLAPPPELNIGNLCNEYQYDQQQQPQQQQQQKQQQQQQQQQQPKEQHCHQLLPSTLHTLLKSACSNDSCGKHLQASDDDGGVKYRFIDENDDIDDVNYYHFAVTQSKYQKIGYLEPL